MKKLLPFLFAPFLIFSLALSHQASAHEGHAGPMVNFMKSKAALKQMLPAGARITKRKQPLKEEMAEWLEVQYGLDLDSKLYSYYLALDKEDKSFKGAAYVGQMHYRHGKLKYAVGIDRDKKISNVAILAINEKYVVDFEGSVGKGIVTTYNGLSLKELIAKADKLASSDKATREFAAAVRDASALLIAFTKD